MSWHRRGRRSLRQDRDARVAVVSFASLGLSLALLASVLFVVGETQLPETPLEAQVLGVHFSVEGPDATKEVTIGWFTDEPVRAAKLKWAKEGGAPVTVWAQNESWYFLGDLLHYVRLQNLQPGALYQFWPGDEDWGYAGPYNYTVPSKDEPALRIAVWGNIGSGAEAQKNRDRMLAAKPDLVMSIGDLSYAAGNPLNWRTWFETMEPLFGGTLMMAAIGHAEEEGSEVQKRGYFGTLRQPDHEQYYAIRMGPVDLIVLDSASISAGGSAAAQQLEWLGRHLAAVDGDPTVKWKVAFMHHAPFATGLSDNGMPLRQKVDALFHQHHVQMAFAAHEGYYERTHVMSTGNNVVTNQSKFAPSIDGTIYWQTAGGGASLGTRGVKQEWLAYADTIHHVTLVDILQNGTAHVRGMKASDGAEFDHVWIGLGAIPPDAGFPVGDGNETMDDGNETDDGTDGGTTPPPPEQETPPEPEESFDEKSSEEPGFELVAAIAAVGAVLFFSRRKRSA